MTENKDSIKQQMQAKFEDFQVSPPKDGWQHVETSLLLANKAVIITRWRKIGIAAALAALIVGGILFMQQPSWKPSNPILAENNTTEASDNQSFGKSSISSKQLSAKSLLQKETKGPTSKEKQKKSESNSAPHKRTSILTASKDIQEQDIKQMPAQPISVKTETSRNKEQEDAEIDGRQRLSKEDRERLIREFAIAAEKNGIDMRPTKYKQHNDLHLTMGGRSGFSAFQKTINAPMSLRSATANVDTQTEEHLKTVNALSTSDEVTKVKANIAEMEHAQPLSFGLTVSKQIVDNLYIETGLVYTYLYSKTKNINPNYKKAETQHFHYLGIPLNINYLLATIKNVDVYFTLGGMVEKDVYGEFRSEQRLSQNEIATEATKKIESSRIRQKRPQFSVNAGIGASYPLYGKMELYGKVGGAYYFNTKNDYKTIYSDRKIMLDLNLGLRFGF